MIHKDHPDLSIRQQCALLSIHRSNIYYAPRPKEHDTIIANEIHDIWLDWPCYGYRRITAELSRRGYNVNHKKVSRLMQMMNLRAIYPEPKTTLRNSEHKIYPYLLKGIDIVTPNQVWATDITYIKLNVGFMYLVALLDLYSRYLVSWRLSNTLDTSFCLTMLEQGLSLGKPEILNTDQGCQFTSNLWIDKVESNDIRVSMDGKGRWADNVFIERFWRTIKHEHILLHSFNAVSELNESVATFIDRYNHKRLHQSLGYKTPAEVYWG